ncbi:uncharacterized protein LOC119075755 [Bradysia coprophila]|uniref:uncharacterized protein LOC119075755 n=1 Tax=Bradysia coprophila TaxID=38358 RepID=UPI00187D9FFB|nr:uncharacterized protein LOC119075755 [Bradysia coprophila]
MNKILIAFAALIAAASAFPFGLRGEPSVLAEWETYKTAHNKSYTASEENFRYNLYLATRAGVETHNKLYENNLVSYRRELDQWADAKLKEITVPGADKVTDAEWNEYKETYGKRYSDEQDEFRRTLYSRKVDEFADFKKLYENNIVSWSKRVNQFTDHTNNEGPSFGLIIPRTTLPLATIDATGRITLQTTERP